MKKLIQVTNVAPMAAVLPTVRQIRRNFFHGETLRATTWKRGNVSLKNSCPSRETPSLHTISRILNRQAEINEPRVQTR